VYRAALPDNSGAEWRRIRSAFFLGAGTSLGRRRLDPVERTALEWLEGQDAPCIEAGGEDEWTERSARRSSFAPNDARGANIAVLPDRRPRQARSFERLYRSTRSSIELGRCNTACGVRAVLDVLARRVAVLGQFFLIVVRFAFEDRD